MSKGWVCPECGLDYDTIAAGDTAVAIRSYPRRFRALVAVPDGDDDERLRRRPEPEVWSALEYTAHVADVFASLATAVDRMRVADEPTIAWSDIEPPPATDNDDPNAVLSRLTERAEVMAAELDRVKGKEWQRTATFPWGERSILDTARNAVHEGKHHLDDVESVLARVR